MLPDHDVDRLGTRGPHLDAHARDLVVTGRSAADSPLELRLRHLGTTLDALALCFLVQLAICATAGPAVRTKAAASSRRDVLRRRAAALPRLTGACTVLVHCSGGDLLGFVL